MPQSYIEYNSGLTGKTFSVPFKYISVDDVHALGFDGEQYVPLTVSSRSTSAKTVTLSVAPNAYEKVRLYRATSNIQLVDFQNGSRLSESDLDTAYQQGLFVAQEVSEDANTVQFGIIRASTLQLGTSLSNFASEEFTGNGTSTAFNITAFNTQTTVTEAYRVSIDGVMQSPVDAYSISMNPSKITFTSAPPSGSKIVVVTAASAASAVSVDDVTIGLTSNNKAQVKDGGITPSKLSTGAPTWEQNGKVTINGRSDNNESTLALKAGLGNSRSIIQFSDPQNGDIGQILYDHGGNYMRFKTNDAERMRISNTGVLMVGTTDSNSTKVQIRNYADSFGYGIDFYGKNGSSSFKPLNFRNSSGSIVGSVSHSNSATSYNTSSDYRLKEDIIELDDSIDRLKALKPCNFAWKADGTRVDGFIAHEAQEVVPEAVTGTKDAVDEEGNPDYQGIDQAKLVPLLTKALQDALTKIETLEARVEALENA